MIVNIFLSLVHKCALVHQKHISTATDSFLQTFLVNPPARLSFNTMKISRRHTNACVEGVRKATGARERRWSDLKRRAERKPGTAAFSSVSDG